MSRGGEAPSRSVAGKIGRTWFFRQCARVSEEADMDENRGLKVSVGVIG